MPKIAYTTKGFKPASYAKIVTANEILEEYSAQGYELTLRQLYYQFVSRGLIANRQAEYDKLGLLVSEARLAGLVDWRHIVDRTRGMLSTDGNSESPEAEVASLAGGYSLPRWDTQPRRVEVWIEKDALVGVIAKPCRDLCLDYLSCRGYTSQSEMWRAAMRHVSYMREGQEVHILHLGDHDPSGLDMTRDIRERLDLFCSGHGYPAPEVHRIALNMDQIEQYGPPPNPAKLSDSRAWDYVQEHGEDSWELDALEPTVIGALITEHAEALIDREEWEKVDEQEEEERRALELVSERWAEVLEFLGE